MVLAHDEDTATAINRVSKSGGRRETYCSESHQIHCSAMASIIR